MSKAPPPLLGFNNNVRHRGRIFHIQTEDSGVKFPRIVTHLFADGGRIVKTTRTDYTQYLEQSDMAVVVRAMMKEQHKGMFASLRAGDLDVILESVCGPLDPPRPKPVEAASDPTAPNELETARAIVGNRAAQALAEPSQLPQSAAASAPLAHAPVADAQAVVESMKALRDSEESSPRSTRSLSNPNLRRPTPSVLPAAKAAFDLDVASLDKHPPKSDTTPNPRQNSPARKSRPPIPVRPGAAAAAAPATAEASGLGRPQTRLAAAPPSNTRSIFGDGAISEQSLDEVILSYLAEDLEESK